jgi:predicted DNA-binding transcriptional regulator AlpA
MQEADYPERCDSRSNVKAPTTIESELLTVNEVAEMLSIGVRSVWRKSQDGRLPPPIKMTGSTRWAKSTIRDWIAKQAIAAGNQSHSRHRP